MPRGRYQQQQWDAREIAILDALDALLQKHSIDDITMDDLADHVGISKATLYQHFSSKDALFVCLLEKASTQFMEWLQVPTEHSSVERLSAIMRYLIDGNISLLRDLVQARHAQPVPYIEGHSNLVAQHSRILDLLTVIIKSGQERGEIDNEQSPMTIITAMWALSNACYTGLQATQDYAPAAFPSANSTTIIRLFERGIRV